jgi:hypothetical protein
MRNCVLVALLGLVVGYVFGSAGQERVETATRKVDKPAAAGPGAAFWVHNLTADAKGRRQVVSKGAIPVDMDVQIRTLHDATFHVVALAYDSAGELVGKQEFDLFALKGGDVLTRRFSALIPAKAGQYRAVLSVQEVANLFDKDDNLVATEVPHGLISIKAVVPE